MIGPATASNPSPEAAPAARVRLPTLDLLRFVAAAMVVLYHYTFRGGIDHTYTSLTYAELDPVTRYGWLGVELFFVISGFVILMTVDAGSGAPGHFLASRISRLFPAFWAAATLTFLVTLGAGEPYSVGPLDYLLNLGMTPSWLGAEYVDGVYWTLEVEIAFYLLVLATLLLLWGRVRTELLLLGWLIVAMTLESLGLGPGRARALLAAEAAPYFAAGCVFYLAWRSGWTRLRAVILVVAWVGGMVLAAREAVEIGSGYGVEMSGAVAAGIVCLIFGCFLVLTLRPAWFAKGGAKATILGALTFPLYLVHQKLGYLAQNGIAPIGGRWAALLAAIVMALLLATLINVLVERRYNRRVRRWLESRVAFLDRGALRLRSPGFGRQGGEETAPQ